MISTNEEEHTEHSNILLELLAQDGLTASGTKCELGRALLTFHGHTMDLPGVRPLPSGVKATDAYPLLQTVARLRQFSGFNDYYQHIIPNCAVILQNLTDLLHGRPRDVQLSPAAMFTLESAKQALSKLSLKRRESANVRFRDIIIRPKHIYRLITIGDQND